MGENIVALFTTDDDAQAALREFRTTGFGEEQVSLIAKHPHTAIDGLERREVQAEATTQGDAAVGVPQEQHAAAQPGGAYLIVRAHSEDEVRRALDLMHRYNVAEIEHREQEYQEGDWAPLDEGTPADARTAQARSREV